MGPYTCNRDTWVPNGSNYACCPNDQGLSTNENDPVIIAEANGNLNACIVTPSSDLVKPTPTPTQNPTANPTPDPTQPPQDNGENNLVDAPDMGSGSSTATSLLLATTIMTLVAVVAVAAALL